MQRKTYSKDQKNYLFRFYIVSILLNLLFFIALIRRKVEKNKQKNKESEIFLDLSKIKLNIPSITPKEGVAESNDETNSLNEESSSSQSLNNSQNNEASLSNESSLSNPAQKSEHKLNKKKPVRENHPSKEALKEAKLESDNKEIPQMPISESDTSDYGEELSIEELQKIALANLVCLKPISKTEDKTNSEVQKPKGFVEFTNKLLEKSACDIDINVSVIGDDNLKETSFLGQVFLKYGEKILNNFANDFKKFCLDTIKDDSLLPYNSYFKYFFVIDKKGKVIKKEYVESFNFNNELIDIMKKYFKELSYFQHIPVVFNHDTFSFFLVVERKSNKQFFVFLQPNDDLLR